MTNKIFRIFIKIVIILFMFQVTYVPEVKATSFWSEIFQEGKDFSEEGKKDSDTDPIIKMENMSDLNSKIYNALFALGVVLVVIVGAILGIQIMWGSIEQQVKAKEVLLPYAIGSLVIFGAFGIWKLAISIFSQLQ